MGFKFYCCKCGLKMEIAENLLGVKSPCPKCGKRFVVDSDYVMSPDDKSTQYYIKKIKDTTAEQDKANLPVAKVVSSKIMGMKPEAPALDINTWIPKKALKSAGSVRSGKTKTMPSLAQKNRRWLDDN